MTIKKTIENAILYSWKTQIGVTHIPFSISDMATDIYDAILNTPRTARTDPERIKAALDVMIRYGGIDGDHHKAWVIDQAVRCLTGCPTIEKTAINSRGEQYKYSGMGESEEYTTLITEACGGDDGPDTYDWNVGIAP